MDELSTQHLLGWGLSLEDYREMFSLSDENLSKTILDYHAGPGAFNVEVSKHSSVTTVHPIHQHAPEKLSPILDEQLQRLSTTVQQHKQHFHWDKYPNPNQFIASRKINLDRFLQDFALGQEQGRYVQDLTMAPDHVALALVSHALFTEHDKDLDHHLAVINQLVHLADEVRIFPLLDQQANISHLVGPVSLALQQQNFGVEIRQVDYHLQENGNAMMKIWPLECQLT